ncbi:MAG: sulfatase family protein, partial [Limisphaerales bacterium]
YYGCVTMLDYHIGRLLKYLKREGLEKDTLVIFTSDNGPEHRPATSFGTPGKLRGAKGHMHEGGYRVPGILKWPGRIVPQTISSEPVNGTDFLPTIAAVVGAKPKYPNKLDGINVFPAVASGKKVNRDTPMLWWLWHARGAKEVSMRIGDYKMLANMLPQPEVSIRDTRTPPGVSIMDFIKKSGLGNFTLYNLKNDPSETTELSITEPELYSSMRQRFIELHAEICAEGPYYELQSRKKKE